MNEDKDKLATALMKKATAAAAIINFLAEFFIS